MKFRRDLIIVALATFCLAMTLFMVTPTRSNLTKTSSNDPNYNAWTDINDDGIVDIYDAILLASAFNAKGTPLTKASIQYDSGWINITDKCGQYFNVTHNLGSTDVMVDMQGKTTASGGIHQKYLGLTNHVSGWSRNYGGTSDDRGQALVQTGDGGYAIAGSTSSFGAGGSDVYLVKTDGNGVMQWNKTYGGTNDEVAYGLVQTSDGGYAMAGCTSTFVAGSEDFYLVKTDSAGTIQWSKTWGGTSTDIAYGLLQITNGDFIVAGLTSSFGAGGTDVYLARIGFASGTLLWNKTYGGINNDGAYGLVQTGDGGYAIAGYSSADAYLVKTDSVGTMLWNKTYGGTNDDGAFALVQTGDGGYALAGWTTSYGAGGFDVWLVKTDGSGTMQWNKTYGGTGEDRAYDLVQTGDGGYAIAGYTRSFGAGGYDGYLVKTDASGNVQWSKTYGGPIDGGKNDDGAFALVQTGDGGYAMAGLTSWSGINPNKDVWFFKIDAELGMAWTDATSNTLTLYRGATDPYWNFVRIRIWAPKTP